MSAFNTEEKPEPNLGVGGNLGAARSSKWTCVARTQAEARGVENEMKLESRGLPPGMILKPSGGPPSVGEGRLEWVFNKGVMLPDTCV